MGGIIDKIRYRNGLGRAWLVTLIAALWAPAADAGVYFGDEVKFDDLPTIKFYAAMPDPLEDRPYPTIIYFLGGRQTSTWASRMAKSRFARDATDRGFIVVFPAAPGGRLYYQSGAAVFPRLFDYFIERFPVAERKFHLMGPSNGGVSSLQIAAKYPEYVLSVSTFPGFLERSDPGDYERLAKLCIVMYVGKRDRAFLRGQRSDVKAFEAIGKSIHAVEVPRKGHNISRFDGRGEIQLIDDIEAGKGC